jgi:hypothetical protein
MKIWCSMPPSDENLVIQPLQSRSSRYPPLPDQARHGTRLPWFLPVAGGLRTMPAPAADRVVPNRYALRTALGRGEHLRYVDEGSLFAVGFCRP